MKKKGGAERFPFFPCGVNSLRVQSADEKCRFKGNPGLRFRLAARSLLLVNPGRAVSETSSSSVL